MKIERFSQSLVESQIVPGISILAARGGDILYQHQSGWKTLVPDKEPLLGNSPVLYDLASLTKPLVTAFLAVYLAEKENIPLTTPARKFLPHLPSSYTMNLQQLLTHSSGLPAWFPFFLFNQREGGAYLDQFAKIGLKYRPGKWVDYSCPGYILLYYLIETISGTSFPGLAQDVLFRPLGLQNTFLKVPGHLKVRAAPTETGNRFEQELAQEWAQKSGDPSYSQLVKQFPWRHNVIRGDTHDSNSYYHDGCAGNAGLFSTCADVHRLCLEFFPDTASLLPAEVLHHFWRNLTPFQKSHRTIGFKRNSSFITSGGRAISRKSIGHNGFTGTSLWLDPRRRYILIVLSNRVHPGYRAVNFDKIRRKLHRLLVKRLEEPVP